MHELALAAISRAALALSLTSSKFIAFCEQRNVKHLARLLSRPDQRRCRTRSVRKGESVPVNCHPGRAPTAPMSYNSSPEWARLTSINAF